MVAAGDEEKLRTAVKPRLQTPSRWIATVGVVRAYVGVGANLGDREATIGRAIDLLGSDPGIEVTAVSRLRETDPWGPVEQPRYLNGVVELETRLEPRALLDVLLSVEQALGRDRTGERWGPRTIDLDLLVHGEVVLDEPGLTVPHPRITERRFALEPLAELAPDLVLPGQTATVQALLDALDT
jgi:2-amino-4-hydroxy-6-hydroxymethyldihydropteridine diphosphokinase